MNRSYAVRVLSLALMASLTAPLLGSCGGSNGGEKSSNTSATTAAQTEPAETEVTDDLGKHDFDGRTFNIVYNAKQLGDTWPYYSEELTGDVLSDAVHIRDQKVSERFNCKIAFDAKGDTGSDWNGTYIAFHASVIAGDNAYDLCINHCFGGFNAGVSEGIFYDFNKVPDINLSKPWWNQTIRENLEVDGVLLTAVSDIIYAYFDVIYFNKDMMKDNGIEYPYTAVKNGTWTWTYLAEITKNISKDLNGDGIMDANDQWGAVIDTNQSTMTRLIHSNGMTMPTFDDNGKPTLAGMQSDKMFEIAERYYDFVYGDNRSFYDETGGSASTLSLDTFKKGHSMTMMTQTVKLASLRDVEFEFGIVPLPKYDEKQENYRSLASSQMLLLPANMQDVTFTGVITEALSAESYREVVPNLFEVIYENKLLRDEESSEMFPLIRASLVYDLNWNYGSGNKMTYLIGNTVGHGSKDFASYIAENMESAQQVLDDVYEAIQTNYVNAKK